LNEIETYKDIIYGREEEKRKESSTDPWVPSPICCNFSKQSTLREPDAGESTVLSFPMVDIVIHKP
jgi:hypothetical protein